MAVRTLVLHSASSGPYRHGERSHARALLDDLPERSLALLDRGYLQANVLVPLVESGHDGLTARQPLRMTRARNRSLPPAGRVG
jgi:hypothetical protein